MDDNTYTRSLNTPAVNHKDMVHHSIQGSLFAQTQTYIRPTQKSDTKVYSNEENLQLLNLSL